MSNLFKPPLARRSLEAEVDGRALLKAASINFQRKHSASGVSFATFAIRLFASDLALLDADATRDFLKAVALGRDDDIQEAFARLALAGDLARSEPDGNA